MFDYFTRKRRVRLQKGLRRSDTRQNSRALGRTLRLETLEDRRVLALVGVAPLALPTVDFGTIFGGVVSTTSYDSATNTFSVSATPTETDTDPGIPGNEGFFFFGTLDFNIKVGASGNLVGGVPGDDLVLIGDLDLDFDFSLDYLSGDGPLLTAEVVAFGYEDSGGTTDQFDFLFSITGGQIADLFPDTQLGVTLTSAGSTFTGDFNVDFGGDASGQLGSIETIIGGGNASISGVVWEDFNNDGLVDFNEGAIEGATVQLLDESGVVIDTTTTDQDGLYSFDQLDAGTYGVMELQPAGFDDGLDIVGEIDGSPVGDNSINDKITGIVLDNDTVAVNYNFGERPEAGGEIAANQTASIAFWQNSVGQALITSVNEGLGDWLAATLPNLYGNDGDGDVNPFDLTGMTNQQVADFYKTEFRRRVNIFDAPPKLNSQVLASAIAVYVTNSNLAGLAGLDFGFLVTDTGVGTATINVGSFGAAFGVENNTDITVLDALFAANSYSQEGKLYDDLDMDSIGDGHTSLEEWIYKLAADIVFTQINRAG